MDTIDIIEQTFSKSDANNFRDYCLSENDKQLVQNCMRNALSRLPYNPYYCVHLNAILWKEIRNKLSLPVYMVAGCLEINNHRIFGDDSTNHSSVFSRSQPFDGHCWVAIGGNYIIEISLFRTLDNVSPLSSTKRYIEQKNQEKLPGAMMTHQTKFLSSSMNYIPKYILSESEINNLILE